MNIKWQEKCRELAHERAHQEAVQEWKTPPNQPVAFEFRWEHVHEVVKLALWLSAQIAAEEKSEKQTVDAEAVEAAAWLHDICKLEANHAQVGADEAEKVLRQTDFPLSKIELVGTIVRQHEGLYRPEGADPIEPIEAAILWDADKLSKLGIRALAHGLSAPYYVGKTLQARRKQEKEWVHDVLSKTVYSMNTEPAKRLAVRRYREMVATLDTWAREETESIVKE